jgi:hypothetical protein
MRWMLKLEELWKELKEPAKGFFAVGGIFAAIGCTTDAVTAIYGEKLGMLILVWGALGAFMIYQSHKKKKN